MQLVLEAAKLKPKFFSQDPKNYRDTILNGRFKEHPLFFFEEHFFSRAFSEILLTSNAIYLFLRVASTAEAQILM